MGRTFAADKVHLLVAARAIVLGRNDCFGFELALGQLVLGVDLLILVILVGQVVISIVLSPRQA